MAHKIEGGEYLTIAEAVDYIGCTDSWVRHLIRTGKMRVRTFSERVKLVPLAEADRVPLPSAPPVAPSTPTED